MEFSVARLAREQKSCAWARRRSRAAASCCAFCKVMRFRSARSCWLACVSQMLRPVTTIAETVRTTNIQTPVMSGQRR